MFVKFQGNFLEHEMQHAFGISIAHRQKLVDAFDNLMFDDSELCRNARARFTKSFINTIPRIIVYGRPGTGKTTLVNAILNTPELLNTEFKPETGRMDVNVNSSKILRRTKRPTIEVAINGLPRDLLFSDINAITSLQEDAFATARCRILVVSPRAPLNTADIERLNTIKGSDQHNIIFLNRTDDMTTSPDDVTICLKQIENIIQDSSIDAVVIHGNLSFATNWLTDAIEKIPSNALQQIGSDDVNEIDKNIYLLSGLKQLHSEIAKILTPKTESDLLRDVNDFFQHTMKKAKPETAGISATLKADAARDVEDLINDTIQDFDDACADLRMDLEQKIQVIRDNFTQEASQIPNDSSGRSRLDELDLLPLSVKLRSAYRQFTNCVQSEFDYCTATFFNELEQTFDKGAAGSNLFGDIAEGVTCPTLDYPLALGETISVCKKPSVWELLTRSMLSKTQKDKQCHERISVTLDSIVNDLMIGYFDLFVDLARQQMEEAMELCSGTLSALDDHLIEKYTPVENAHP